MNITSSIISGSLLKYQGQMSIGANRLNRSQFPLPTNNASRSGTYGVATAEFVTNIRTAASDLTQSLRELSRPAFDEQGYAPLGAFDEVSERSARGNRGNGDEMRRGPSTTIRIGTNIGNDITATVNTSSRADIAGLDSGNQAVDAIQRLVSSFNRLRAEGANRVGTSDSQGIEVRMINISNTFASTLSNLGIGPSTGGGLRIDPDRLNEAAQDGRLERFFAESSGSPFSFSGQLERLANDVRNNPASYVANPPVSADTTRNFQYSSTGSPVQFNFLTPGSILDFML